MIIDCHTHLLPSIDDGARDLSLSLEMLQEEARQGVNLIIATPHFYGDRDRMENFIQRRTHAFDKVKELLDNDPSLPKIKLGAEVAYFPGISKAEGIEQLCIEGTNAFLLEMPFKPWDEKVINEVLSLANDRGLKVVLAHIERYLRFPGQREKLEILASIPVCFQVNAESLLEEGFFRKKRSLELISWFETNRVCLMGSDTHNMETRKPNLELGRNKLSSQALNAIDNNAKLIFNV